MADTLQEKKKEVAFWDRQSRVTFPLVNFESLEFSLVHVDRLIFK